MPPSEDKEAHPGSASAQKAATLYAKGCWCAKEGDFTEAAFHFARCVRLKPDHLPTLAALALVLYKINQVRAALTGYRRALRLSPDNPDFLAGIGNCYMAEGDFAKATAYFERALKADPDAAGVMYNLTMLQQYPLDAPMVKALRRLYDSVDCTGQSRALVCFTLGRIQESHGDLKQAFRYYAEGNAVQFPLVGYDEARAFGLFEAVEATFTRKLFERLGRVKRKDANPIFIVGMPRSGSSLVEQILASHSGVYGAGEVNILPWMVGRLIPRTFGKSFPRVVASLDISALRDLGDLYLELLSSHCHENGCRIVSKTLENYLQIGLIRILFPRAPIIHCVRDPMDTCWSMFRHYFGVETAPGYCYDQQTLGRYYRRYQRLMDHWHKVLPGEIHDVRYEELVERPEETMLALLEYCGLPWEAKCLAFYRTKRVVNTSSAVQVRRRIYKTSIRSWLPVAEELAPLRRALEEPLASPGRREL